MYLVSVSFPPPETKSKSFHRVHALVVEEQQAEFSRLSSTIYVEEKRFKNVPKGKSPSFMQPHVRRPEKSDNLPAIIYTPAA